MNAIRTLLVTAFRHPFTEANVETAFERFQTLTDVTIGLEAFHSAVADCVTRGLIREPVELPDGALQCRWRLELTPEGVAAARMALAN